MVQVDNSPMSQRIVDEFLNDLDGHVYPNVEGLTACFLEHQNWSEPVLAIAKEVATSHSPVIKSFEDFAPWIEKLQSVARPYKSSTGNHSQFTWSKARPRESIALANGTDGNKSPSWSNVLALGEVNFNSPYIIGFHNLCAQVNTVFAYQPARILVHGFYLSGSNLEMWVFDRAGVFGSKAVDITKRPDLVTHIVASYLLMDDVSLGLSGLIENDDGGNYIECKFDNPTGLNQ